MNSEKYITYYRRRQDRPECDTVLFDFNMNISYSITNIAQGKPNIIMGRYRGTQQRYLISGPLYCVLYDSWKRLEGTVRHVFLWRVSLWIGKEPITDKHDTIMCPDLARPNLVLRVSHLSRFGRAERSKTLETRLTQPTVSDNTITSLQRYSTVTFF